MIGLNRKSQIISNLLQREKEEQEQVEVPIAPKPLIPYSILARMVKQSYNRHYGKEVRSPIGSFNYVPDISNDELVCFYDENSKELVIAVRGTDVKNLDDLRADASIVLGQRELDPRFNRTFQQILNIVREYNPITEKIILTGHSLGAATSFYAFEKLKGTPFFKKLEYVAFNGPLPTYAMFEQGSNVRIYRTSEDIVSAGTPVGFRIFNLSCKNPRDLLGCHSLSQFI